MRSWKNNIHPTKQNDLEFQVALRDVALKNHALTHLILWIEAHLRAETPHAEIRQGLEERLAAGRPTAKPRQTEVAKSDDIWAGDVCPVDAETTRQIMAANGIDL